MWLQSFSATILWIQTWCRRGFLSVDTGKEKKKNMEKAQTRIVWWPQGKTHIQYSRSSFIRDSVVEQRQAGVAEIYSILILKSVLLWSEGAFKTQAGTTAGGDENQTKLLWRPGTGNSLTKLFSSLKSFKKIYDPVSSSTVATLHNLSKVMKSVMSPIVAEQQQQHWIFLH